MESVDSEQICENEQDFADAWLRLDHQQVFVRGINLVNSLVIVRARLEDHAHCSRYNCSG